ncbi:MAG: efflux RND transporter periplasmic adaptor subunit [Rikenellaceae bacterium]|nr:efflux RND transporter periplasmic adaptor subunit [Rikenellaceae bacterium]
MKRKILSFCMLCLLASCGGSKQNAQTEVSEVRPKVTVETAAIESVDQVNTFTGTIEAQVANNIAPQSPMRIGKIYVEVGDHVRKGQLLVSMDTTNLAQAEVQMLNNRIEFERADELYKVGGTSKSEWDAKKLAYQVSKSNYDNLKENTSLQSPISGVITARNYDNGDMYSASNPILTVEQIRPVKLIVNISEVLFTKVKKGMEVEVTTDVYGDRKFTGRISIVYPTIDPATRTFPIEVRIDNADESIRPGMFARVVLRHDTARRVVISDKAVLKLTGAGDRYVYIIDNGKARYSKVELGRRMGDRYEVLSGVEEGEKVVVTGHTRLNNGIEVEITDK